MDNEIKTILNAAADKVNQAARHCIMAGNDCEKCPFYKRGNYNICYQKFMQFTIAFTNKIKEVFKDE